MSKRRFSTEQIIQKLREAEVELAKGRTVDQKRGQAQTPTSLDQRVVAFTG